VDKAVVEDWIRAHVKLVGAIEVTHERPWATVCRVPLSDGVVWFKACEPVQAFEPRLTAQLFARWPDRVTEVLGQDEERGWLLLGDAGTPMGELGNPPEKWLDALPIYAELQRGEAEHASDHLAHSVPDLRVETLPVRYEDLVKRDLPLAHGEIQLLREFAPRFAELCGELASVAIPETIQHDDLHMANLFMHDQQVRVIDWGDASISQPFASLVVTFSFLEQINHLPSRDPWFARLRDAYLEPWGKGLDGTFDLAMRVGAFAHAIAWERQRAALPEEARADFNTRFRGVLQRAVERTPE
jgi:hypothetical protein